MKKNLISRIPKMSVLYTDILYSQKWLYSQKNKQSKMKLIGQWLVFLRKIQAFKLRGENIYLVLIHYLLRRTSNILQSFNVLIFLVNLNLKCFLFLLLFIHVQINCNLYTWQLLHTWHVLTEHNPSFTLFLICSYFFTQSDLRCS